MTMTFQDEAKSLAGASAAKIREFVERAVHLDATDGISDDEIENARRKVAAGYRISTVALELKELLPGDGYDPYWGAA
jgi:predicted Ser/Thr protein kinase